MQHCTRTRQIPAPILRPCSTFAPGMAKRPRSTPNCGGKGLMMEDMISCGLGCRGSCLDWVARVNYNLLFDGSLGVCVTYKCGCMLRCQLVYEMRLADSWEAATFRHVWRVFRVALVHGFTRFTVAITCGVPTPSQGTKIQRQSQWVGNRCHPRQTTRQQHFASHPTCRQCMCSASSRPNLPVSHPGGMVLRFIDRHRDNQ